MKTGENLAQKKCQPCEGKTKPMTQEEASGRLPEVPGWKLEDKRLVREIQTQNFLAAVAMIENIAAIAEQEEHHPDLHLTNYRKLRVELSTHAIGGLSENDFILAAKINQIPYKPKA